MNRPDRSASLLEATPVSGNTPNGVQAAPDTYRATHGLATQTKQLLREVGGFQPGWQTPRFSEVQT